MLLSGAAGATQVPLYVEAPEGLNIEVEITAAPMLEDTASGISRTIATPWRGSLDVEGAQFWTLGLRLNPGLWAPSVEIDLENITEPIGLRILPTGTIQSSLKTKEGEYG